MFRARQWSGLLGLLLAAVAGAQAGVTLNRPALQADPAGGAILTVPLSGKAAYRYFTLTRPDRVVVDVLSAHWPQSASPLPGGAGPVTAVRIANRLDGSVRVVLDLPATLPSFAALESHEGGVALVVRVGSNAGPAPVAAPVPVAVAPVVAREPEPAPRAAARPAGRDLVIAIDAGHGGKDPGAHGPKGIREKDITLRLSKQLAAIVDAEPGMRAFLTRSGDEFIPLRGRMERARAARADLFLSIHADAVYNRSVRGASVYVLNEKGATDEASRRLAARENAADLIGGVSLRAQDRMLASVLLDLSQGAALSSSIDVAGDIIQSMASVGTVHKPRVMQAPFMVLKSPDVPSVLVETAFISNPTEEQRLNDPVWRERLARSILGGVRNYFYRNPPEGSLIAALAGPKAPPVVEHRVQRGESLSALASRYGTSVERIRSANGLQGDRLAAGRLLRIPLAQET